MPSQLLRQLWKGKWALVTGASAGIGEALAVELAQAGVNLVLTARRRDRLEALAQRLGSQHSIQSRILVADLTQADAPAEIFANTEGAGLAIEVLINNAGFGEYGEFVQSHLESQLNMVQVNCTAVVHLSRLFLPKMVERRSGAMMIVASTAAYQPVPYLATYSATKAFDRMLAEALAEETKDFNVKVSALCPGPTVSEFDQVAGSRKEDKRPRQSTKEVALRGLEGLAAGKPWVIPYFRGQLQVFAQRLVPRRVITQAAARMMRPAEIQKR